MSWSGFGGNKVEVVNQKVEDLKPLVHKMEKAIEKLSELNTSVSRMLAVHEERITKQEEIDIVENQKQLHPIENLEEVASDKEINEIQESIKNIYIDDRLKEYIVEAVEMTRTHDDVALGSSPRGSIAMFNGAKALAFIRGRDFILPDDIKELASPILSHRIVVSSPARMRGIQSNDIIDSILSQISVPGNINLGR